jgi:hypothetical protein
MSYVLYFPVISSLYVPSSTMIMGHNNSIQSFILVLWLNCPEKQARMYSTSFYLNCTAFNTNILTVTEKTVYYILIKIIIKYMSMYTSPLLKMQEIMN